MKPPDKKKLEEFKKQFQTSNFSANEYIKWKRSGGQRLRLSICMESQASKQDRMGLQIDRKENDRDNADAKNFPVERLEKAIKHISIVKLSSTVRVSRNSFNILTKVKMTNSPFLGPTSPLDSYEAAQSIFPR